MVQIGGIDMTAAASQSDNLFERAEALGWTLNPLSPTIGCEVLGVDLKEDQSEEAVTLMHDILHDYKVMFFRDQDITPAQHVAFGRYFGDLEIHPFAPTHKDFKEILPIVHDENNKGKENAWHSDVTWREEPSLGSILWAKELPPVGGDTLFADMEQAYEDLPDDVKEKLDGATARHDFVPFKPGILAAENGEELLKAMEEKYPNPHHPVIRTHPKTGRKSIYVNIAFTQEIDGWDKEESDKMLAFLYSRASVPEYQCRFRWEKGSIAFWDNRSCQHYAASDYWPQRRAMHRVTVIGDKPV